MDTTKKYQVEWKDSDWKKMINEKFLDLIHNEDRYVIMYGSRNSTKSSYCAKWVMYKMLMNKDFRGVLIRNVFKDIKDSSFEMVKRAVEDCGLGELFKFTESPLQITCYNGAKLLCRGLDDVSKLKSINANFAWWEEDIPRSEQEWLSVSNGIRSSKCKVQEVFTINPEVDGHYTDNWFWKKFFEPNVGEIEFKNKTTSIINGKPVSLNYTVHHSTYLDNRWCTDEYKASMLQMKERDPYYYTVQAQGLWGIKANPSGFYKRFQRGKNSYTDCTYNPELPLHISFDFNVNPFMSATVWQVEGLTATCINEITTTTPNNTSAGICKEIIRQYNEHESGMMYIYGDASGKHADTRSEYGVNDFKILYNSLSQFNPALRVPTKNPSLVQRGNFINSIFYEEKDSIQIKISDKCVNLLNDLVFTKEASDGSKLKERTTKDGISYEKFGHLSDTLDYIICECFKEYFKKYTRGGAKGEWTMGKEPFNSKYRY